MAKRKTKKRAKARNPDVRDSASAGFHAKSGPHRSWQYHWVRIGHEGWRMMVESPSGITYWPAQDSKGNIVRFDYHQPKKGMIPDAVLKRTKEIFLRGHEPYQEREKLLWAKDEAFIEGDTVEGKRLVQVIAQVDSVLKIPNPMPGVPGGGIAECIEEMSARPDVDDPGALCAWIAEQRGEFGHRSLPHIKRGGKKTSGKLRSVMRRATNQSNPCIGPVCVPLNPVRLAVPDEAAEFALKRWGRLSWRGPQDRDLTWKQFAKRIEATGDPGSEETAEAVRRRTGRVLDFAVPLNPRPRKKQSRKKNPDAKQRAKNVRSLVARALK